MTYIGKEPQENWIYVMYNWFTLLCSGNEHNIVNQLYSIKLILKRKWKEKEPVLILALPHAVGMAFDLYYSAPSSCAKQRWQ